jgi:hypothetical protein
MQYRPVQSVNIQYKYKLSTDVNAPKPSTACEQPLLLYAIHRC